MLFTGRNTHASLVGKRMRIILRATPGSSQTNLTWWVHSRVQSSLTGTCSRVTAVRMYVSLFEITLCASWSVSACRIEVSLAPGPHLSCMLAPLSQGPSTVPGMWQLLSKYLVKKEFRIQPVFSPQPVLGLIVREYFPTLEDTSLSSAGFVHAVPWSGVAPSFSHPLSATDLSDFL